MDLKKYIFDKEKRYALEYLLLTDREKAIILKNFVFEN
ncbi:hypothetical protein FEDK69T_04370 [Flavobacterium enshiense DK69]|nr:hypothetical protein FEDK69T_04370 [Flavobacterium enshiense DK69]